MAELGKQREVKKTFFDVQAPLTSARISLYAASAQELLGRIVRLDLTRSLRGKGVELRMRVALEGEELHAEPIALEVAGSYIRRMVRKGADYVEDSFQTTCKDARVLIKPFLITRKKVSRALRHALRTTTREHLIGHATLRTSRELFTELLENKLQKELSQKLKKIYPLALCEVRVFAVVAAREDTDVKEEEN